MPRRPRGKLVRWSTELNEKLLLAIQSGCNETGTVLPMDTIASHMNSNASPNAILQHLAKMRRKREEDGLQNPPPLRRGGRRYDVPSASTNSADQADTDSDPDYAVISSNKRAKTKPGANKAANPSAAPAASPKVGSRKAFVAASLPAVGGGEDLLFSSPSPPPSKITTFNTTAMPRLSALLRELSHAAVPAPAAPLPASLAPSAPMSLPVGLVAPPSFPASFAGPLAPFAPLPPPAFHSYGSYEVNDDISTGFGAFSGGSFVVDDEMDMEEAGVFGGGPEWAW